MKALKYKVILKGILLISTIVAINTINFANGYAAEKSREVLRRECINKAVDLNIYTISSVKEVCDRITKKENGTYTRSARYECALWIGGSETDSTSVIAYDTTGTVTAYMRGRCWINSNDYVGEDRKTTEVSIDNNAFTVTTNVINRGKVAAGTELSAWTTGGEAAEVSVDIADFINQANDTSDNNETSYKKDISYYRCPDVGTCGTSSSTFELKIIGNTTYSLNTDIDRTQSLTYHSDTRKYEITSSDGSFEVKFKTKVTENRNHYTGTKNRTLTASSSKGNTISDPELIFNTSSRNQKNVNSNHSGSLEYGEEKQICEQLQVNTSGFKIVTETQTNEEGITSGNTPCITVYRENPSETIEISPFSSVETNSIELQSNTIKGITFSHDIQANSTSKTFDSQLEQNVDIDWKLTGDIPTKNNTVSRLTAGNNDIETFSIESGSEKKKTIYTADSGGDWDQYAVCTEDYISQEKCDTTITLGTKKPITQKFTTPSQATLNIGSSTTSGSTYSQATTTVGFPYDFQLEINNIVPPSSILGGSNELKFNINKFQYDMGMATATPNLDIKIFRIASNENLHISTPTEINNISCSNFASYGECEEVDNQNNINIANYLTYTDANLSNYVGKYVTYIIAVNHVNSISPYDYPTSADFTAWAKRWIYKPTDSILIRRSYGYKIYGGNIFTNGQIKGMTPVNEHGSWASYGIIANSSIDKVASGAAGENNKTTDLTKQKVMGRMTIANTGIVENNGNAHIDQTGIAQNIINENDLNPYFNLIFTDKDHDYNLTNDITTSEPNKPNIIIAKNINISNNVTEINAWLIATNTITTCVDASPADNFHDETNCNNALTINGPVFAKKLNLNRAAGDLIEGEYAEIMNYLPNDYIKIYKTTRNESMSNHNLTTEYIRELPPRY